MWAVPKELKNLHLDTFGIVEILKNFPDILRFLDISWRCSHITSNSDKQPKKKKKLSFLSDVRSAKETQETASRHF